MPDVAVAPLAVLAEKWPLRDVLILTYNSNLGFFERAALARVRSRGARVTLVSDADMVHADPEAVRYAGHSYLDGRALCHNHGACHPKLVVTVSDDQAAVLVGSGNASPGGWVDNAELWTLLRADGDGAPETLHRVAEFLLALPDHVRFTPGVADVLSDVAASLQSFHATEAGPTVVSSVWGPIIEQLPEAPNVAHLTIATPFHDKAADATRQLYKRLQPDTLEVLIQDATVFDGERLAGVLDAAGGTLATITSRRYHHGKLIEWSCPDEHVALTGSLNASGVALLKGMADGGNCELGLVGPVDQSLRPATGDVQQPAEVTDREWEPPPESAGRAAVSLLAVLLETDGIRVVLREPLDAPAQLQHLVDSQWVTIDSVAAAVMDHLVTYRLPGAAALRLVDESDEPSNVVWVTDLSRTSFRTVAPRRTLPSQPLEIALDPHLVTMVEQALATVRAWSAETAGPAAVPLRAHIGTAATRESWRDYIDGFRADVGDDFSFFALPHLMRAAGAEPPQPSPQPGEPGDDGEGAEEAAGDELERAITARLEELQRDDRMADRLASYRRMCEKLNTDDPARPRPVLVAATALTVGGVALGCWKERKAVATELRRSLRPLARLAGDPDLAIDAANIAAVALAVIRAQVRSITSGDEATMQYRHAAREVRHLLVHATDEGIADRAKGLVKAVFGPAMTTMRVREIVESVTAPDHIAAAVELLYVEHGTAAEVAGTCIRITDPVAGDGTNAVLRAIGLAQDAAVVGAVASGPKGAAAAVWRAPLLAVVRRGLKRRVTLYKFSGLLRPSDYGRAEGILTHQYEQGNWFAAVPDHVQELLLEGGVLIEDV